MKFLKIIVIIIAVLAGIILVGGIFLPKTYSVSRTQIINAPDSIIYTNIANFNEFVKWNPWSKMEPNAKITISGAAAQENHLYEWNGKENGQGQMLIKSITKNQMVDIELKFIKPFETIADTRFDIEKTVDGNLVTWTMSGESENIFNKWMNLFMDKMIGKDFEDGLKFLKEKTEQVDVK